MEKIKNSKSMFHSFIYAFKGMREAFKESRNLRFHFFFGIFTVAAGIFFRVTLLEWTFIVLYIGAITAAEMFNTAIEDVMNLLRDKAGVDYAFTGKAKDIAAGATLAITISAIITGFFIFWPRVVALLF